MKFSFPILNKSELLQCLEDFEISMPESNYKNPQREQMQEIYYAFVEKLMGVKSRDFQQLEFSALELIEYPNLHEDSIPRLTLNKALFHLMKICGATDFSMRDITHPEFQRTRRNLSALINFTKFRETQLKRFQDLQAETEMHEITLREAKEKVEILQGRINDYLHKRELEEEHVQQLEIEIEERRNEVNELNQRQANLQREIHGKKDIIAKKADQMANLKFQILDVKSGVEDLQSKVVKSPKRIKKENSELARTVAFEKADILEMEKFGRDLSVKHDSVISIEEDLQKTIKFLDDLELEVNNHDAIVKGIENLREKIDEAQQELKAGSTSEQHLQRLLLRSKEKKNNLYSQHESRVNDLQDTLRNLKEEKLTLEKTAEYKENTYITTKKNYQETLNQKHAMLTELQTDYEISSEKISQYVKAIQNACEQKPVNNAV